MCRTFIKKMKKSLKLQNSQPSTGHAHTHSKASIQSCHGYAGSSLTPKTPNPKP
jgi:hypothetical protein